MPFHVPASALPPSWACRRGSPCVFCAICRPHTPSRCSQTHVRDAITQLGVERTDHGIRLADDADLMAQVAASGMLLTVCPLSNVRLGCVGSVAELPIRTFLERGVRFSINSDDPAYFGGYILDNYIAVQKSFKLRVE